MELALLYTNECYASKEEVRTSIGDIGLESVWTQIQNYRNMFKMECQIMNIKRYFVLTPQIFQGVLEKQSEFESAYILMNIKDYERHLFRILLKHNCSLHYHSFIKMHPLIQIYMVLLISSPNLKEEILALVCDAYGYQNYQTMFQEQKICLSDECGMDATRPFLEWLEYCCGQIQKKVLNWNRNQEVNEKQLQRLSPEMMMSQCSFYVKHHAYGYYYDVEEYMQFCDTSYETARVHMQKMVDAGWYRKIKAGKKFVYTVLME